MSTRVKAAALGLGFVVVAGGALAYAYWGKDFVKKAEPARAISSEMSVVATVNGVDIRQAELASIMATGVDRGRALDLAISKQLAASIAHDRYGAEAESSLEVAKREVLAQLFVAKRSKELRDALKPEQISAYYAQEMKAGDFDRYKVFIAAFSNLDEAKQVVEKVSKAVAGSVVLPVSDFAQFKPVVDGGNSFVLAQQIPAGLGWVAKQLKPGQYSQLVAVPGGHYMVHLTEVKAGQVPALKEVEPVIKQVLVRRAMDQEIAELRKKSSIALR